MQENIQLIRQHENTQREMLRMAMKVKDVGSKETQIIALEGKCFRLEQENGEKFSWVTGPGAGDSAI